MADNGHAIKIHSKIITLGAYRHGNLNVTPLEQHMVIDMRHFILNIHILLHEVNSIIHIILFVQLLSLVTVIFLHTKLMDCYIDEV